MKKEQFIKDKERKIVITHLTLDKSKDDVFAIAKRSRELINAICAYSKDLKRRDIEVFERHVNIIRTELGYYCAFFQEDLDRERTKKKEEDELIKPFKGFDGRLKVKLQNKEGEDVIEDLATLVALTHVKNPENYQYVKFKDGNNQNCEAANLYWSETE